MKNTMVYLIAVFSLTFSLPASARHYSLSLVDSSLHTAIGIAHAGDDRIFVVNKEGLIWIYRDDVRLSSPFLDIRDKVKFNAGDPDSEQGLLSLAFHPNYASNGYFFVTYTDNGGNSIIARYGVSGPDPDHSPTGSERVLLRVVEFGANHNVNHVAFGPDGMLYIGAGDGGYLPEPRCTGQQPDSLHGKILRLDVDQNVDTPPYYGIPAGNPFVGASPVYDEVWAMGVRNPWRFSFDRATGDFWLADVGHHRREEIDFLAAGSPGGQNYGFKMMEGFLCLGKTDNCDFPVPACGSAAYTPPVLDYGRDSRHCAIIGGHVYRGAAIPALQGAYLAGDFCGATFLVHHENGQFRYEELSKDLPKLMSFGEDVHGETYLTVAGSLYKLVGIDDQVVPPAACLPSDTVLCLAERQFRVTVSWRDYQGQTGNGHALPLDYGASGLLYFFDPTNIEMLVKTLDGCAINGHFWVYAAATTDVEYTLRVTDTRTGQVLEYRNPLGVASPTVNDIRAFACG